MDLLLTEEYKQEQQQLLNYYLNTQIFPPKKDNMQIGSMSQGIELIIRPQCTQQCDYCYITNFGKELYPIHLSNQQILDNLSIFLNYVFVEKEYYTYKWDLFAGDLFADNLFFDIMDIFEKYFIQLQNKFPNIFLQKQTIIDIPTNLDWAGDEIKRKLFLQYYNKFNQQFNCWLHLSWSTDGMFAVENREKKNLTEEYFQIRKEFISEVKGGYHPMVSASNVKNWAENNYQWWIDFLGSQPMILEVRNNDWNKENLKYYKQFLQGVFNYWFKDYFNNNVELFAEQAFNPESSFFNRGTNPIALYGMNKTSIEKERTSCAQQCLFIINLSNMSLPVCHRLTYPNTTGGYCQIKDNQIINIIPHNLDLYVGAKLIKDNNQPKCISCIYAPYCLKGCLGSQFETNGDIFVHCKTVCDLFKVKYQTILHLYKDYGVLDYGREHNLISAIDLENFETILTEEEFICE